ncbi:IS630 family transposase [Planococcus lenghuensis]|nr:IS630 family transposase [Planococcus lenghuensis]
MAMNREAEIQELQTVMNSEQERRMFERYQAVRLVLEGKTQKEAAAIIGRTEHTVGSYMAAYKKGGLAGLQRGTSTGRPPKLTAEQRQELRDIIAHQTPADVGFPARANWTLGLAVELIERKWGETYSPKGLSQLFDSLGLSFTRPTYTLKKADPEKQAEFRDKTFPDLKKLMDGKIDRLLFEDESMIRDYQAIGSTWFLRGQQRMIPTFGQHKGVKLIGTLDYETGEIICTEEERYGAGTFLRFLEKLLTAYPTGKLVMILDNARIHHAKLIQPFLEENRDRLELVFLPPYSPQLNLMEGVWKWLKEAVIHNVFFGTVQKITLAVRAFLKDVDQRREEVIDRLCVRM